MKRVHMIFICAALLTIGVGVLAFHPQGPRTQTEATEAGSGQPAQLVPLPIKLPQAQFQGTPPNIQGVTNLEKPLGRDRPPFLAPRGVVNVALHKPVTSSVPEPMWGELAWIVDGDKEAIDGSQVDLDPFSHRKAGKYPFGDGTFEIDRIGDQKRPLPAVQFHLRT